MALLYCFVSRFYFQLCLSSAVSGTFLDRMKLSLLFRKSESCYSISSSCRLKSLANGKWKDSEVFYCVNEGIERRVYSSVSFRFALKKRFFRFGVEGFQFVLGVLQVEVYTLLVNWLMNLAAKCIYGFDKKALLFYYKKCGIEWHRSEYWITLPFNLILIFGFGPFVD